MKTSCLASVHASHANVAAINPCRLEKPNSTTTPPPPLKKKLKLAICLLFTFTPPFLSLSFLYTDRKHTFTFSWHTVPNTAVLWLHNL